MDSRLSCGGAIHNRSIGYNFCHAARHPTSAFTSQVSCPSKELLQFKVDVIPAKVGIANTGSDHHWIITLEVY